MRLSMKKALFILQEKHYNIQYVIYIKMLKLIGYEIHIITDIKSKIKYCDKQYEYIFKISKYKINKYEIVFCDSKILEILIKLINKRQKNKIIYMKSKKNFEKYKKEKCTYNFNMAKDKYIFCSIGEFNKTNNQIMQLESMIRIIKKYPKAQLLLLGQGKLKEYYEHIIEKYGLSENVQIIENLDEKIDIIKKSNSIISTRRKTEFALDWIIALILNKPIITLDVGINKFIFKKENIFKNSDDLKEKMKKYIDENKCFEKYYDIEPDKVIEILKEI